MDQEHTTLTHLRARLHGGGDCGIFVAKNAGFQLAVDRNLTDFYLGIVVSYSVVFQLPLIMLLLVDAGVINLRGLVRGRKVFDLCAFAVSAYVTPPDVLTQFIVAAPAIMLFEVGRVLVFRLRRVRSGKFGEVWGGIDAI